MNKAQQKKKERLMRQREVEKKKEARRKGPPPPPPKRPATVREALGVKPLKMGRASDMLDFRSSNEVRKDLATAVKTKAADPLPDTAELDDASPEQRAHFEAAKCVDRLLANKKYPQLVACMVAMRRMYAVFYRELQESLEKEENLDPLAEDFIIQAMMHKASEAFSEHELFQGVVDTVLPTLAELIDSHTIKDEEALKAEKQAAHEERFKKPVPIGFKHTSTQVEEGLVRDKSLVLTGWAPALAWLADQIVTHVLKTRDNDTYGVIRFMTEPPKRGDFESRLIRLPKTIWAGCGNSKKALALVMGEYVADKLSQLPDVLLCDNIGLAHNAGFTGRPEAAAAGDANKVFTAWGNQAACAVIGMLPLDTRDLPDIRSGEYEQLRNFSLLRPVAVEEIDDDQYRITVGDHAAVFKVKREVVDAYNKGRIVLPN